MPLAEAGTSENGYVGVGEATADAIRDNAGEASVPTRVLRKSLLLIPARSEVASAGLKRIAISAPVFWPSEQIAVLERLPLFS